MNDWKGVTGGGGMGKLLTMMSVDGGMAKVGPIPVDSWSLTLVKGFLVGG